jgi:leucyl aminopeptidase
MSSPTLRAVTLPLAEISTGGIVVPVFDQDPLREWAAADAAAQGELARALDARAFKARPGDVLALPLRGWETPALLAVGAGRREDWGPSRARQVATAGALAARQRGAGRVALVVPGEAGPGLLQAAAEGLVLAAHDGDVLKTTPRDAAALAEGEIACAVLPDGAAAAIARGALLGDCTNLARAMAIEPGNRLPPRVLALRAQAAAEGTRLTVEVLDDERLRELGMGLLLGVGQGSAEPPRLIAIEHVPAGGAPAGGPVLGLVGKGITFDTGGISIKPADGMERMKTDMSGGAAVIAAMRAISLLDAPVRVVGVVPAAENMPGGRAIRPGDVLVSASGKTVEVNNTDAEGRLILADALWYAQRLGATHLVDVATLTGSCVIALGRFISGLFGNDESWSATVRAAADAAGDRVWPLPLHDELADQLRSDIADLVNTGGRPAGAITAAMFLREFAGGRPWVHLDIAGTAWVDEAKPWQPKGATGVAVRTLAGLALTPASAWPAPRP